MHGTIVRDLTKHKSSYPYRYGWYSPSDNKNHYFRLAVDGGNILKVTNQTRSSTSGLSGWPDAVYVGEVVPDVKVVPIMSQWLSSLSSSEQKGRRNETKME